MTFSVFFFFFGNPSSMVNLYELALSENDQLPFIKTFVREFIQCRIFLCVLQLFQLTLSDQSVKVEDKTARLFGIFF